MQRQSSHANKKVVELQCLNKYSQMRGQEYGLISKASVDKHGDK